MKPANKNNASASKRPSQPAPRRPLRKLFQLDARPLDNTAPGAASLRELRRSRPWLASFVLLTALLFRPSSFAAEDPGAIQTNAPAPPEMSTPDAVGPLEDHPLELPPGQLDPETIAAIATNVAAALSAQAPGASNPPASPGPAAPERAQRQSSPPPADQNRRDDRNRSSPRSGDRNEREQQRSPAIAQGQAPSSSQDFSAYRIISERNIFDPNRNPRRTNTTSRPRPRTVDSFALVGIMSYEKGTFAFFDGSRGEFKKAVKQSGEIAGFKVASVNPDAVRLSAGERHFDLKVGMQLRREEDGPWEPSSQAASFASVPGPSTSGASPAPSTGAAPAQAAPSSSGGSADEVLRRLMQRREQE